MMKNVKQTWWLTKTLEERWKYLKTNVTAFLLLYRTKQDFVHHLLCCFCRLHFTEIHGRGWKNPQKTSADVNCALTKDGGFLFSLFYHCQTPSCRGVLFCERQWDWFFLVISLKPLDLLSCRLFYVIDDETGRRKWNSAKAPSVLGGLFWCRRRRPTFVAFPFFCLNLKHGGGISPAQIVDLSSKKQHGGLMHLKPQEEDKRIMSFFIFTRIF